jgi:periplasmic divalent cation tolerance protein
MDTIAVFTTIDSREQAEAIATALVERGLAACVQISEITSVYSWQGRIENDREFRVMAKTLDERYAEIEAAIRELHSYDLPAIYAVPVSHAFAPYAEWVEENTTAHPG